ncbi:unnamed protein product [Vitrella brassicaformis CCMP3155]|uniref:Tyrosine-protein kinase ephrin type A/B receptor-like domain-containing protein n=1 Tax=Vitrella brassicaformis (strain CCMP3155) TaxID=1169540 RepID=A0A0G4EGX8_VITBC|nr:unnamed protein product [Vitrella brassicaformis CCMP3155]|eukprot:CEL95719.1 unnamed protein product [Vitrella brassicaformis CCMP3155]
MSLDTDCICGAGYQPSAYGRGYCTKCGRGVFKGVQGNIQCTNPCPLAATSDRGATSEDDCYCGGGFYAVIKRTVNGSVMTCNPCEGKKGWKCGEGVEPQAEPDYWQPGALGLDALFNRNQKGDAQPASARRLLQAADEGGVVGNETDVKIIALAPVIVECPEKGICVGNSTCKEELNLQGYACGQCKAGYTRIKPDKHECISCQEEFSVATLAAQLAFRPFSSAIISFYVAKLTIESSQEKSALHSVIFKILTTHLQVVSVLWGFDYSNVDVFFKDKYESVRTETLKDDKTWKPLKVPPKWPPFADDGNGGDILQYV